MAFINGIINLFQNLPFQNVDLIFVGVSIAGIFIMGFIIYLDNKNSITNRTFFSLSIAAMVWGAINYLSYQNNQDQKLTLWLLKIVLFFAVWFAYYLFKLMYVYPENSKVLSTIYKFLLLPLVIFTSLFTLTPYIFPRIAEVSTAGSVSKTQVLPGIYLFGFVVSILIFGSFYNLIKKTIRAKAEEKAQYRWILVGTIITFSLIITFNFILAGIFLNVAYIPLSGLFLLPFVVFTAYAINKHKLFNLPSHGITYGILIFIGCATAVVMFIFVGDNVGLKLMIAVLFVILLIIFGAFMRILFELDQSNIKVKALNRVMSHDVKAALGKNGQMFLEISEGTFDNDFSMLKSMSKQLYLDDNSLLQSVMNILTNKTGIPTPRVFNLKEAVLGAIDMADKSKIKEKNLKIETHIDETQDYTIYADRDQISTHVLQNLVDNAILYHIPNGFIKITLNKKDPSTFHFEIEDNGSGISEEDKKLIFTEGGHGTESYKLNKDTTGEGLFLAKRDVAAHEGKIWFISTKSVGTTFYLDLPVNFKNPGATSVKIPDQTK